MSSKKIRYIVFAVIIALFIWVIFSSQAFGADYVNVDPNKIFDPGGSTSNAANSPFSADGGIGQTMKTLIQGALLPIGIIFSCWRCLYIAIFCYIAGVDPLGMVSGGDGGRYDKKRVTNGLWKTAGTNVQGEGWLGYTSHYTQGMQMSKGDGTGVEVNDSSQVGKETKVVKSGKDLRDNCGAALKIELKFMVIGLAVTACAWVLVELISRVAIIFIDWVGGISLF